VQITVDEDNFNYADLDGVLFNKKQTCLILYPQSKVGGYSTPDSVKTISSGAFINCTGLTSLVLPKQLIDIACNTISDCSELTSIIIPSSVNRIGNFAFSGCTALTSLTIPDSVTEIGSDAFSNCPRLTSVILPDSVVFVGAGAFSHCTDLTSVIVSDCGIHIGQNAFSQCPNLSSVTIQNYNTKIEAGAFSHCPEGLSSLKFPTSKEKIAKDKIVMVRKFFELDDVKVVSYAPLVTARFKGSIEYRSHHVDNGIFVDTINPNKVWLMERAIEDELAKHDGDTEAVFDSISERIDELRSRIL
jgi:hypothetical protein